jgi:pullulanase/glycogen debranching enzyme
MQAGQWDSKSCYCIAIGLRNRKDGRHCMLLFNAQAQAVAFTLPEGSWTVALDTGNPQSSASAAKDNIEASPYSVVLLTREERQQAAGKVQPLKQV